MRLHNFLPGTRPSHHAMAFIAAILLGAIPLSQLQAGPIIICKLGYQGLVSDAAGVSLNGNYSLTFRIFDMPAGGSLLWQETHSAVPVTDGLVNLALGDVDPLPVDVLIGPTDSGEVMRYLEVQVGADPPASPRTQLLSTPYAMGAYRLAGDIQTMPGDIKLFGGAPPDGNKPVIHLGRDIGGGEVGIIVVDGRPGPLGGTDSGSVRINAMGGGENSIIVVGGRPGEGKMSSAQMGTGLGSGDEVGIIVVDGRPGERVMTARFGAGLNGGDEAGIIVVDGRPGPLGGTDSGQVKINTMAGGENGIIVIDSRPGEGKTASAQMATGLGTGEEVGIIVVDGRPGPSGGTDSGLVKINAMGGGENSIIVVGGRPGEGKTASAQMGTGLGTGEEVGIIVIDSRPVAGGDNDSGTIKLNVTAGTGSSILVGHELGHNVGHIVNMNAGADAATLAVVAAIPPTSSARSLNELNSPSGSADAFDSVSVIVKADSLSASLELFVGSGAAAVPSIVLEADILGGRVGINTSTPTEALDVVGNICVSGSVGACSDLRYKQNINTIDGALDKVASIRGVEFDWRRNEFEAMHFAEGRQVGVIAQDVEAVLPELVSTRDDGYKAVDYSKLTAVLIEAVKELRAENSDLRTRLESLEASDMAAVTR